MKPPVTSIPQVTLWRLMNSANATGVCRSDPLSNTAAISSFVCEAIGWSQVVVACRTSPAVE
jgi:hypothetical protein